MATLPISHRPQTDPSGVLDDIDRRLANPVTASQAMDELIDYLRARRSSMTTKAWDGYVAELMAHPIRERLHRDPFTHRAFAKPRGYAGDARLLDYIYRPDDTADLAPDVEPIFEHTTGGAACQAVRNRCRCLATLIDRTAERCDGAAVASVVAGNRREAGRSQALADGRIGRFVALDQDAEGLAVIERDYGGLGVTTTAISIRPLLVGKSHLGQFDLIYAAGLYDYLDEPTATRLTDELWSALSPGGTLLIPNLKPDIRDIGYVESFMGWKLILRSRQALLRLLPTSMIARSGACASSPSQQTTSAFPS